MKQVAIVYSWNRLSFPMWLEPRPQSEMLKAFVEKCFKKDNKHFTLRFYQRCEIEGEKSENHWSWEWPNAISEEKRLELQLLFEEYFGECGQHFRWEGTRVIADVEDVYTMGKHIQ